MNINVDMYVIYITIFIDIDIYIFNISRHRRQHFFRHMSTHTRTYIHKYQLQIWISCVWYLEQSVDGGEVALFGRLQQRLALLFHGQTLCIAFQYWCERLNPTPTPYTLNPKPWRARFVLVGIFLCMKVVFVWIWLFHSIRWRWLVKNVSHAGTKTRTFLWQRVKFRKFSFVVFLYGLFSKVCLCENVPQCLTVPTRHTNARASLGVL